jgi:hypothetical protein
MGEIQFIRVRCQITWRPSLFIIGSLVELLILIDPLFQLQYSFIAWQKPIRGPQRSLNNFVRPSNSVCFAYSQKSIGVCTRSFWNNIGSVVYFGFGEVSNNYYFWENGNCNSSSEEHLRNTKTSRGS